MCPAALDLGIIFLTQTAIGFVGNVTLLCFYNFTLLTGNSLRHTDMILNQLVLANSMILSSKSIPQTLATLGWSYFLNDVGCKLIFYFHRVGTGVSFSTVCLLNSFQTIKLNPSVCTWIQVKIKSLKFIGFCCFLCWIPHLLINSHTYLIVNGPLQKKNLSAESHQGYCSWTMPERYILHTILYFSPDLISLGFMAWASGLMVLSLHRHKKRVQHIHSHSLSKPRCSHEDRATRIILILVSSFVTFYSTYTVLTIWMTLVANRGQWIVNSTVLVASCFPVFSPYVLILSDTRLSRFGFATKTKKTLLPNVDTVLRICSHGVHRVRSTFIDIWRHLRHREHVTPSQTKAVKSHSASILI